MDPMPSFEESRISDTEAHSLLDYLKYVLEKMEKH